MAYREIDYAESECLSVNNANNLVWVIDELGQVLFVLRCTVFPIGLSFFLIVNAPNF
jgi:hypothetical protein